VRFEIDHDELLVALLGFRVGADNDGCPPDHRFLVPRVVHEPWSPGCIDLRFRSATGCSRRPNHRRFLRARDRRSRRSRVRTLPTQ